MRPFWLALGFLSTFPVPGLGEVRPGEMRSASAYYPAVGYLIGLAIAMLAWLTHGWPQGLQGALLLGLGLGLTGMLHLDGLLDSADALLSVKTPAERLRILSDVHLGSFAFGVGVVHLLLKWQLLSLALPPLLLLCTPALARFAVLIPMNAFPAARQEGLGATAREGQMGLALLFTLPALLFFPLEALVLVAFVGLLAVWASGRLGGGLSGDIYGAIIELGESAVLLSWAVKHL